MPSALLASRSAPLAALAGVEDRAAAQQPLSFVGIVEFPSLPKRIRGHDDCNFQHEPASAAFAIEPMAPSDIQATFFNGKP